MLEESGGSDDDDDDDDDEADGQPDRHVRAAECLLTPGASGYRVYGSREGGREGGEGRGREGEGGRVGKGREGKGRGLSAHKNQKPPLIYLN